MNGVRYIINRKILNGKQLVGYEVLDSCGNTRNLAVQDVKQLCKNGILLGVKLDNKTGQLRGDGVDLRTIKSVQMQELEKDQLKRQSSSTNTDDKLRKLDNIVYYETIRTDKGSEKSERSERSERIAYLRAKGYHAVKIDNIQADSLVIYRQDEDETQKYLMLDPLQVKVKHLVIVNIQCDLFGMIENYITTSQKKTIVSSKDQQSFIRMTIDFINRLDQLNYIKDDDYLLEPKIEDVRYFETNANWFNGQNNSNNNEFYFKYRNIVNRLGLSLTKYMNKLYNDHVVRQIMNGTVKLRYLSDKVQTFKSFERQLELEKLGGYGQVKSCKTFRKSLLSYKIDETTVDKVDNGPDALIELDLDVVDRLVKDCKDFDILRKLAIPNMQVVKCYRSQLKGKQVKDSSGFSNGVVVEPYKIQEYLLSLADKIRTEKYSKYKQSLSNKEAEKLLLPLENKLRLIYQSNTNTKSQEIIGEKIVNYLIDIYNRDNSLGYKLPIMLIYLASKYCPKTMDNIGGLSISGGNSLRGLQASWVRQTTCPDYKDSEASGNCDKSVLDIDLNDYMIGCTQFSVILNRPELSIFITDLYGTFGSDSLNKENIFIDRFDFSDYNFLNVNTFNSVFTGAEIGEVILDGLWFSRLKNFTGVFNNAKIDKVIIKNCDLSNARQSYGIFSNFAGKVLILNSRLNPKAKGLIRQFDISFGKDKTCDSLYSSNVQICTDMYGEQHYIRSKNLHNGEISELYTNSVDVKYFRENKVEIEDVIGPNGTYTGEVKLRYLRNFADLCEYGDSASKQKKDYEICRKGEVQNS